MPDSRHHDDFVGYLSVCALFSPSLFAVDFFFYYSSFLEGGFLIIIIIIIIIRFSFWGGESEGPQPLTRHRSRLVALPPKPAGGHQGLPGRARDGGGQPDARPAPGSVAEVRLGPPPPHSRRRGRPKLCGWRSHRFFSPFCLLWGRGGGGRFRHKLGEVA